MVRYQNVIVGGGIAGGMVAQEYREQGGGGSVLLVAHEQHTPYHRPPLTKEFLRGEKPADEVVYMHPGEWWREHEVELRTGTDVTAIDPGAHTVTLADGDTVEYERLVLATGSTPRPLAGSSTLRTVDDSQALAERLAAGPGHLGVVGGGFIGVEAAASARMKGWDVTMAVREQVVWEKLFGAQVGTYFQRHLEAHGVRVHTGTSELPDGSYDVRLAGVGVTPNTGLAEAAGLAVEDGVQVDESLRAAPDVWAVGDIAAYQSAIHGTRLRVEHWDVALNHGAYVGRMWAGKEDGPYRVVPYFFSDIGDWTWFEYVGPGEGRVDIRGSMDSDDFAAYYLDDADRVTACLAVNRSDDIEAARAAISGD